MAHADRLLDNVLDASRYPLPAQEESARSTRRIGLGITGLGVQDAKPTTGAVVAAVEGAAAAHCCAIGREAD